MQKNFAIFLKKFLAYEGFFDKYLLVATDFAVIHSNEIVACSMLGMVFKRSVRLNLDIFL